MAYSPADPVDPISISPAIGRTISGHRYFHYSFSEEEGGAATEFELASAPSLGTIVYYKCNVTAGTGTTIQPEFGGAAEWTTDDGDHITQQADAHTISDGVLIDSSEVRYSLGVGRSMFGRTIYNAGSDNEADIEVVIVEGHRV